FCSCLQASLRNSARGPTLNSFSVGGRKPFFQSGSLPASRGWSRPSPPAVRGVSEIGFSRCGPPALAKVKVQTAPQGLKPHFLSSFTAGMKACSTLSSLALFPLVELALLLHRDRDTAVVKLLYSPRPRIMLMASGAAALGAAPFWSSICILSP